MSPEDALFAQHNVDRIASESLNHQEDEARVINLTEALLQPEVIERIDVDMLSSNVLLVNKINTALSGNRGLTFGKRKDFVSDEPAEVSLFKSHETVESEAYPGVQFSTSLISIETYKRFGESEGQPVGKLLLLKLDHSEAKLTSKDLELGVNTRFGALLTDGELRPFKLTLVKDEDKVISQIQRSDPAEESGVAVDAQLIEKGNGYERLVISELDPNEDAPEHSAIIDEIDKFIRSRKATGQPSES